MHRGHAPRACTEGMHRGIHRGLFVQVTGHATSIHDPAPLALLVDRDLDTRRMYAEYLRLSGCAVEEAEDGREALAKAISHHPNVIVTETRLPGINGFD